MEIRRSLMMGAAMVAVAAVAVGCGSRKQQTQGDEAGVLAVGVMDTVQVASDNAGLDSALSDNAAEIPADEAGEEEYVYIPGDTLCVYDGKTVMFVYEGEDEDPKSPLYSEINTYRSDSVRIGTCRVNGHGHWAMAEGETLKIPIGADTLYYPVASLPQVIDPDMELAGPGMRRHTVRDTWGLKDSMGWKCKFTVTAVLPEKRPKYIARMLAALLYADVEMAEDVKEEYGGPMKEYEKLEKNPKRYMGLNVGKAAPEEIGRYFWKRYLRIYKKEFAEPILEGWTPPKEYVLEAAPVWESEDGGRTTYRFYTYTYGGGAHGMMYEYYLTFDNASGRVLGYRELLGDEGMREALGKLKIQLNKRKEEFFERPTDYSPDLGEEGKETNLYNLNLLNEIFEGKVYPRPAITRNGVVFTYQPYDMGCFAEGIMHFVIPINQDI